MANGPGNMSPEEAASCFQLSDRAAYNYVYMRQWVMFEQILSSPPWTPERPDGLVNLGVAENALMHREVAEFISKNDVVDPVRHLSYGLGPRGSPRLRKALASFLNRTFAPREPVQHDNILILPGVGSVTDSLAWCICNEGEGIIIPQPLYTGFNLDIPTRARGVIVPASFQSLEGYRGFDDVFDPAMNARALERALKGAEEKGIRVRAVLVANPHNPLGRCYPADTLKEIASFCSRHKLHLISDEIYANTVFDNPKAPCAVPFTSILSLDLADRIDPQLVHVAYGASKDFCASGLRLGVLYTRNKGLLGTIPGTNMLAWTPYLIQELWAKMLEDERYTSKFIATNQRRLAEQYAVATRFLDKHRIPYSRDSNAGLFIWGNFGKYLVGADKVDSLVVHRLSVRQKEKYQQREQEMSSRFLANGVGIAMGSGFFTEELGWFRLTFTVSRQALEVGLQRMWKTLQELDWGGEGPRPKL